MNELSLYNIKRPPITLSTRFTYILDRENPNWNWGYSQDQQEELITPSDKRTTTTSTSTATPTNTNINSNNTISGPPLASATSSLSMEDSNIDWLPTDEPLEGIPMQVSIHR